MRNIMAFSVTIPVPTYALLSFKSITISDATKLYYNKEGIISKEDCQQKDSRQKPGAKEEK